MLIGFDIYPSKPSAMKRSRSPFMACAVRAIKDVFPPTMRLIVFIASTPFIPGSCMSIITRSGIFSAASSSAFSPDDALSRLKSNCLRAVARSLRLISLSSTMRTVLRRPCAGPSLCSALKLVGAGDSVSALLPGMVTVKRLPAPGALFTAMVPP